jgi:hypothetical protein
MISYPFFVFGTSKQQQRTFQEKFESFIGELEKFI